ncbi:hypothetical protein KXR53_16480 [Inquilinus limosus]|uniref:hypothetical protein n=1 Tax=Inquilinus limosus TaxID=171674 RepID=UPI003F15F013
MRAKCELALLACAALIGAVPAVSAAGMMTDEEIISSAESAAPEAVAKNATIIAFDDQMKSKTVRQGTNGFTCMPDNPRSPGKDPMCLDQGGLAWAQAWMARKDPPKDMIGLGYMLAGGSDASNTDPFASTPTAGGQWVDTGPHIMIFNAGAAAANYPKQGDKPDTKAPYVMWAGTPYEHLMVPVE